MEEKVIRLDDYLEQEERELEIRIANMTIKFVVREYGWLGTFVYGTLTFHNGSGRKTETYQFVQNESLDKYPIIKGKPYNEKDSKTLLQIISYYRGRRR